MTGHALYEKATALGVLPIDAPGFYELPWTKREAWDELAAHSATEIAFVCDECGDTFDEDGEATVEILNPSAVGNPDETPIVQLSPSAAKALRPKVTA